MTREGSPDVIDVGAYCRQIEDHLARVNSGHLIRIVGPGFELVRGWALAGIPVSVACHGISTKAERHHAGRATRPLRLEFCEADVRAAYEHWRRAVGLFERTLESDASAATEEPRRKTSLTKHLERAVDKLSRVAGRLDLPESFRSALAPILEQVAAQADDARRTRGGSRERLLATLEDLDRRLLEEARAAAGPEKLDQLRADSADELAAYRSRLDREAWQRSVDLGADRLLRDRLNLPTLIP